MTNRLLHITLLAALLSVGTVADATAQDSGKRPTAAADDAGRGDRNGKIGKDEKGDQGDQDDKSNGGDERGAQRRAPRDANRDAKSSDRAEADRDESPVIEHVEVQRRRIVEKPTLTLDEAVDRAQRRHNARVIRADVRESDGRPQYVLRMLSEDGRVWTVKVDAVTGKMK